MRAMRVAAPIVLAAVLLSGLIVLASGIWFIEVEDLAGTDRDWTTPGGALAMGFFALVVGALATVAGAVLARWFPLGLAAIAVAALAIGYYVTIEALDQKPVLAPMFILQHALFVGAFGILLPYRLYALTAREALRR